MDIYVQCLRKTPVGDLYLYEENGLLISIGIKKKWAALEKETPVLALAKKEILEYFDGTRRTFTFPIKEQGTSFQRRVYQICRSIPYGCTSSYKKIAEELHMNRGYQAIGQALSKNELMLVVPCHRVISESGRMLGYAYPGSIRTKARLIQLEKAHLNDEPH